MSEGHLLVTVCAECGRLAPWRPVGGRPEGATPPQICEDCWHQRVRLAYWRDLTGLGSSSGSGSPGPEGKDKPPTMPPQRTATSLGPPPQYGRVPTDAPRDPDGDDADAPSLSLRDTRIRMGTPRMGHRPGVAPSYRTLLAALAFWAALALSALVGLALLGGALGLLLVGLWRVLGAVAGYLFSGGAS